jgi:hypothetical protein
LVRVASDRERVVLLEAVSSGVLEGVGDGDRVIEKDFVTVALGVIDSVAESCLEILRVSDVVALGVNEVVGEGVIVKLSESVLVCETVMEGLSVHELLRSLVELNESVRDFEDDPDCEKVNSGVTENVGVSDSEGEKVLVTVIVREDDSVLVLTVGEDVTE